MNLSIPAGVFFGETVNRREIAGFRLSEAWYPPNLEIPSHSHECANFCFVLQGGYAEIYEGRPRTCKPSTLVFHPVGEVHSDRHGPDDTNILCVEIEAHRLDAVREHSVVLDTPADFQGGPEARLAMRLCRELQSNDNVTALAIEGLTLELMAGASRRALPAPDRKPPRWLAQACELIRAEYAEPLTLGMIAQTVGVHPVHLAREFRRHYRCTVADQVRSLRVEAACRRLASTRESLGEIALSIGFADQSHFTRTFKQITGLTPSQYRKLFSPR